MKRPLLGGFLFLILAIILADLRVPLLLILMISFLVLVAPLFFKAVKTGQVFFVLVIFSLGFALTGATIKELDNLALYDRQTFVFAAKVEAYPVWENKTAKLIVKVRGAGENEGFFPDDGRFILSSYGNEEVFRNLEPGHIIEFSGILISPEESRNPGGFNYKFYLKSRGIDGMIRLDDFKITGYQSGFFEKTSQLKNHLEREFSQAFKAETFDLFKGILFGDKGIDQKLKKEFQDLGVGHILAVSGLHVGFLFLFVSFLLARLKIRKKYWLIFILPILFVYAFLTGFSASVLRASIMLVALLTGQGYSLEQDPLNNLLLAGMVILLIWPLQLFQAGFQLSMAAVLGIILFYQPLLFQIEKRTGNFKVDVHNPLIESLVLTGAVLFTTLPISIYHFGNFTMITFLANLFIIPLTGLFVLGGFLFMILDLFKIPTALIVLPITFLGDSLLVTARALNQINDALDFFKIQNGHWDIFKTAGLLLTGFFLAGYLRLEKRWVKIVVAGGLSLVIMTPLILPVLPGYLEVTMLDVGQGDSIIIKSPKRDYYLIDGGGYQFERAYQVSDQVLYPAFRHLGIKEIEAAFLTHNHEDHKQGIEELIADGFPVDHLFMSVQTNNESLQDQKSTPVTLLKKGNILETRDGLTIEVLHPDGLISPKADSDQNNASLVMLLTYQEVGMLFCGDMEREAEAEILPDLIEIAGEKDIQVIKVGHHGSKTSSTEAFIQAVDPELALISVGKNNSYGHPDEEVVERFETVLRTDQNGAIFLKTNGRWLQTKTKLRN